MSDEEETLLRNAYADALAEIRRVGGHEISFEEFVKRVYAKRVYAKRGRVVAPHREWIEAGWKRYLAAAVSKNAGATQIQETRIAFFAGAKELLTVITKVLEPGSEPTENDLRLFTDLQQELESFGRQLGVETLMHVRDCGCKGILADVRCARLRRGR